MTLQQFSLIWNGRYDSLEPGQRLRIDERSTASFRGLRWSSSGSLSRGIYVCVSSFPVGFSEESCPSEWSRERSAPSSVARVCRLTPPYTRTTLCRLSLLHHTPQEEVGQSHLNHEARRSGGPRPPSPAVQGASVCVPRRRGRRRFPQNPFENFRNTLSPLRALAWP